MAFLGPPAGVSAAKLFRMVLLERPESPIDLRLSGCEDISLSVRAITASEESSCFDVTSSLLEEARLLRSQRELISRCLYANGERAFSLQEEISSLAEEEISVLANAVARELDSICPTYVRSDWKAWTNKLEEGARDRSNTNVAISLSYCFDAGYGGRLIPRPDRFWGVPFNELLDGHWMCLRAARAVYG